jgi:tetratricopeptide (TPR) repeat protein
MPGIDEKAKGILLRCARSYFSVKAWEKAIKEYEGLVKEFPEDPFILEPLSICYVKMGQSEAAKEFLVRAIHAYNAKGHPEKAEKLKPHFDEVLKALGESPLPTDGLTPPQGAAILPAIGTTNENDKK